MFTSSVFYRKYPFLVNLVQKIKIASLSWNLVLRVIRRCRIQWWCSLFSIFDRKYPCWVNLVQNIKILSLSGNLATKINLNMLNSMVVFTFSILDRKNPFWGNLVQKSNIDCLKWKWRYFRLFDDWANFPFTTSETKRDC